MNVNAIKHVAILLLSAFAGSGLTFLLQAFLARWLTLTEFGNFSAALSIVYILAPLASMGVANVWLKIFSAEGYNGKRWLYSSYTLITKSILLILTIYFFVIAFVRDVEFHQALLFLSLLIVSQVLVELVCAKLQLEERYTELSWFQTAPHLLRVFAVFLLFLVVGKLSYIGALLSYLSVSIFITIFCIYHLKGTLKDGLSVGVVQGGGASSHRTSEFEVLNNSYLFCCAALLHLVMFQGGMVFLKLLGSALDVAIFNAAFMIIIGIYLIPAVIYQKYLQPKIHRWANFDAVMYLKSYRMGLVFMFSFGFVIAVLIYMTSGILINTIFGDRFHASIAILELLCLGIPIRFMATCSGAVLNTKENIKIKVGLMTVVAFVSISLSVVFIPEFGAIGVCYSFLISEALLMFLYAIYSEKSFLNDGSYYEKN